MGPPASPGMADVHAYSMHAGGLAIGSSSVNTEAGLDAMAGAAVAAADAAVAHTLGHASAAAAADAADASSRPIACSAGAAGPAAGISLLQDVGQQLAMARAVLSALLALLEDGDAAIVVRHACIMVHVQEHHPWQYANCSQH